MRTGWRIEGSMKGRNALWLGALAAATLLATGCSSTPLDGYRIAWVGPIYKDRVSTAKEALHVEAQDELASALERNEIFAEVTKIIYDRPGEGVMLYITGVLKSEDGTENFTRLEVKIRDAVSAGNLLEETFEQADWEVSGPEATVPLLIQRLVEYIAEHKSDSPSDRKP